MRRSFEVRLAVTVTVEVDEDAATDDLGSPWNPARMDNIYKGVRTPREMLEHWAFNCVANGVSNAGRLDGWPGNAHWDEPRTGGGHIRMDIDYVEQDDVSESTTVASADLLDIDVERPREEIA